MVRFLKFHQFWVLSHMADPGSTRIRVVHVLHDPIQVGSNVARVAQVVRASDAWRHNCSWRQFFCEVCF